jgi:N-acetylmuramoyl-L-alanine amidase
MHYTAGASAAGAIAHLTRRASRASAHVVIARDGSITQLVPFDRVAWHAGVSSWNGRSGLNRYSLGLELDNAGRLQRRGGLWQTWFGAEIPEEEVVVAVHQHEAEAAGWHRYPAVQLEAAFRLAELLINSYGFQDILGHDDIAPGRKQDPGPAFPLEDFRRRLFGPDRNRSAGT